LLQFLRPGNGVEVAKLVSAAYGDQHVLGFAVDLLLLLRGSTLIRTGKGKLPSGDLGNHNRITGSGCAYLYDLARDDLTNRIAAILQVEQAQSTDIGKVENFPFCRL
jgi:hypothetical protein